MGEDQLIVLLTFLIPITVFQSILIFNRIIYQILKEIIMNKIASVILVFVSFIAFSCSEKTSTEPKATFFDIQGNSGFVGTVEGTDAFISLLVARGEVIAYVCNGDEEINEWFRGPILFPVNITLINNDGAKIVTTFSGTSYKGEVTLTNGSTFAFTASPNTGNNTGIFRVYGDDAVQEEVEGGWIVNSIDQQRGAIRVGSKFTRITLETLPDGTSNTVTVSGKSFPVERFYLRRSGSFSYIEMNG